MTREKEKERNLKKLLKNSKKKHKEIEKQSDKIIIFHAPSSDFNFTLSLNDLNTIFYLYFNYT